MSGVRRAFLDVCPGERRGVVTLDGRPEHLLLERTGEAAYPRVGERWRVRLGARSPDRRQAFVDLGAAGSGLLRLPAKAGLAEGALLEAEVLAEPQGGKFAKFGLIGPATGAPGLLAPGPSLETQLRRLSPDSPITGGSEAREAADTAQEVGLAILHRLRGGAAMAVETTRAMIVVDVDLETAGERGARALEANLRAIRHTARLLRLKRLGGTVAIDLIGFPKAMGLITAETQRAFAPDGSEVVIAPLNRFGVLMLSLPRRLRPLQERLLDPDGRPTPRTLAQRLVRELEREGRADPGALLQAVCPPEVASELGPLAAELGPRFGVRAAAGLGANGAHIERR